MTAGEDAFARSLARKACAQIIYAQAERLAARPAAARPAAGPKTPARPVSAASIYATESVADALADIAQAFVEQVGRAANARTELAGRTRSNALDVLAALSALAPITNANTRDLAKYALYQEIPFPLPVPQFPVLPEVRKRTREIFIEHVDAPPEPAQSKAAERAHIEPWMPPLPSSHTYVATPVYVNTAAKKRASSAIGEQRRQVEMSLAQLKEAQGSTVTAPASLAAAAAAAPHNPFLAPPKVGAGGIDDEHTAGDSRELVEPVDESDMDARDMNTAVTEVPNSAANDQKRARVERILAEGGGVNTTMESRGEAS